MSARAATLLINTSNRLRKWQAPRSSQRSKGSRSPARWLESKRCVAIFEDLDNVCIGYYLRRPNPYGDQHDAYFDLDGLNTLYRQLKNQLLGCPIVINMQPEPLLAIKIPYLLPHDNFIWK